MPNITFMPKNIIVNAAVGEPLLSVAKRGGLAVHVPCGGTGGCKKCLARVISGDIDINYKEGLPEFLFCQAKASDVPAEIMIKPEEDMSSGKFIDGMDFSAMINTFLPDKDDYSFMIDVLNIEISPPRAGDGYSDYDRLCQALEKEIGEDNEIAIPLPLLQNLPTILRKSNRHIIYYKKSNVLQLIDIVPLNGTDMPLYYGLAIDIGTTTISVCLVDSKGDIIGNKTSYNTQIECGPDIISRINYAKKDSGRIELANKVLETINLLTESICEENNVLISNIYHISIGANTTMVHMLMGIIPEYIRLDPYTPAVYKVPGFYAGEIGLNASHYAPVYFAPAVGSYVGGDILAGLLCTPLASKTDGVIMFIDIGTNGEIVLGGEDFIMACACSAGPAFEGGGISCGMRAANGAIEKIKLNKADSKPEVFVMGDVESMGICGSGIISVVAELFNHKIVGPDGKLTGNSPYVKGLNFYLTDNLFISENDIINLIRAKAAVFSACKTLLDSVGMDFNDITHFYIAGGFGRYLNIDDAATIGLLPALPKDKVHFLGNSSLIGAYLTLLSGKQRDLQKKMATMITYIDLMNEPSYMDEYTAALFLPHTNGYL